MAQVLMCIKSSPALAEFRVEAGKTYTLLGPGHCKCGKSPRMVTLSEHKFPAPEQVICIYCGGFETLTHVPFLESRFVPLNDPDAKVDDVIVGLEQPLVAV